MGGAASSRRGARRRLATDELHAYFGPGGGGTVLGNGGGVKVPSYIAESDEVEESKSSSGAQRSGGEKNLEAEDSKTKCDSSELGESAPTEPYESVRAALAAPRKTTLTVKPKRQSTDERLGDLARGTTLYQPRNIEMNEATLRYVTVLPKGGHWLKLGNTTLQFGCPPETIKDSMTLGLDVPKYFVVLGDLFSRTKGVNYAELEFPCYFNFFIRKQRTVVLTTPSIEKRIRALFRETLLGPAPEFLDISRDFPEGSSPDNFPDFVKEGEWLDPARKTLSVDSLIEFRTFEAVERDSTGHAKVFRVDLEDGIAVDYYRDERAYRVTAPTVLPEDIPDLTIYIEDVIRRIEEESSFSSVKERLTGEPLAELPVFGVTMLGTSHGFDPKGQTTGFVLWANRRGTMVDPPPMALECLDALGISSRTIDSIVLTHCHSDHDAGAFRRLLFDQHITIYTTRTIFESFIRKYSNVCGFSREFLEQLLLVRCVLIGQETFIHGASWRFFYSLHTIPCIGFEVKLGGKSIAYSADTNQSPELFERMYSEGIIGKGRMASLSSFAWEADMILHEAGVPPIHTPMTELLKLPQHIKEKLYVVHVAQKDVPKDGGFQTLQQGDTRSLEVPRNELEVSIEILDVFSTIDLLRDACDSFKDALGLMYLIQNETFEPNELIVRAGDPGDRIFIITKGAAEVTWEHNGVKSTKRFHVGDYFGEASLVTGEPRNADVTARGHVRAATLSRQHFEHLISGTNIKQNLIALAKVRTNNTWQLISNNSVTKLLTSTAKTQLETAMEEREYVKGEVVWEVGDAAEMVMFVQSGAFHIKADPHMLRERRIDLSIRVDKTTGKFEIRNSAMVQQTLLGGIDSPTRKSDAHAHEADFADVRFTEGIAKEGAFIGDFDAVFSDCPVASTVVCLDGGTCFLIPQAKWKQFCRNFPGGLIFFMNKHITL